MKWRPRWEDDDVALARDVLDRQLVDTSVRARYRTLAILAAGVLVLVTGIRVASVSDNPAVIGVQWRYCWPAQPISAHHATAARSLPSRCLTRLTQRR